MNKTLVNIMAAFIPNKQKRKKFRKKHREAQSNGLSVQFELFQKQFNLYCANSFPKATGLMRTIQSLNFETLCEVDRLCRKHNISYWLDFGTLLGAIRHKGFIPWDDDLDISMLSEDYIKFQEVANEEWVGDSKFRIKVLPSVVAKLLHKDFVPQTEQEWIDFANWAPQKNFYFGMDIFPWYYIREDISEEMAVKVILDGYDKKREAYKVRPQNLKVFQKADEISQNIQSKIISKIPTNKIFKGLESFSAKPRIFNTNDIFPLIELEFEGKMFFAPGHWHKLLTDYYGNYGEAIITHTHLHLQNIPKNDLEKLMKNLTIEEKEIISKEKK